MGVKTTWTCDLCREAWVTEPNVMNQIVLKPQGWLWSSRLSDLRDQYCICPICRSLPNFEQRRRELEQ